MKNKFYSTLVILFYAICIGPLLFATLSYFMVNGGYIGQTFKEDTFLYVAIAVSVAALGIAFLVYNNKILTIKDLPDVKSKLTQYRTFFLLRMAIIEGACLLNIVFYLLSGNLIFIYFYIGLAFVLFSFMPSINKICTDIQITEDEMKAFV